MVKGDMKEIVIERIPESAIELALVINPDFRYSRREGGDKERNNKPIEQKMKEWNHFPPHPG